MLPIPFEIVRCSWPRPVLQSEGLWVSEPEWDAPAMPQMPQPKWENLRGELCWTIDWRDFFGRGLRDWDPQFCGEMRGFHIIFHIRIHGTGKLVFWDDDGCFVRRHGEILHMDRSAHALTRYEIHVRTGELLEVAQWQLQGGWLWGAHLEPFRELASLVSVAELFKPYLQRVERCLRDPTGPPLKLYTHGAQRVRALTVIYSMMLNGYAPSEVCLYGEHQWDSATRDLFDLLLPFARVIPTQQVLETAESLGGYALAEYARRHWVVFKTCVAMLCRPAEFCLIDDDVLILDRVDDALAAFQDNDLVFAPDADHAGGYQTAWGRINLHSGPMRTGNFNAGLYWARNRFDLRQMAANALRIRPDSVANFVWEQGFIATLYANQRTHNLPTQRYFYPLFDGLPCGPLGYDYGLNPCGFVSIHFGGLPAKPNDAAMLQIAPALLSRSTNASQRIEEGRLIA
jgi:hypothetical protein